MSDMPYYDTDRLYKVVPKDTLPNAPYPLLVKRESKGNHNLTIESDQLLHIHKVIDDLGPAAVPFSVPRWHAFFDQYKEPQWKEQHPELFPSSPRRRHIRNWILVIEQLLLFPLDVYDQICYLAPRGIQHNINTMFIRPLTVPQFLIRPYLGKRQTVVYHPYSEYGYSDCPIYVDQLEELGLNVEAYSRIMAEALAIIYWKVKWDAHRIKFVLSPARVSEEGIECEFLGRHAIWVAYTLECRPLSMTRRNVEQAVWRFFVNEPYCPRPGRKDARDQANWQIFREAFLNKSRELLEKENLWLADLWIARAETWGSNTVPGY